MTEKPITAAPVELLVRHFGYSIPQAHAANCDLRSGQCPTCGKGGRWRNGVGFEHEKICMAHTPASVWCPSDIEDARAAQAEDARGRSGDGI